MAQDLTSHAASYHTRQRRAPTLGRACPASRIYLEYRYYVRGLAVSLKFTILGFLLERPMHGYELKRVLTPSVPADRLVNDGLLYPLLRQLERDGLVRKRVRRGGKGPAQHVLHPTAKGRRAFRDWLTSQADESEPVTYDVFLGRPFLNKCLFLDELEPEDVAAKLAAQQAAAKAKLAELRRIRTGMVRREVRPSRIAIIDLAVAHQRETVRWLARLHQAAAPTRKERAS